VTRLPARGKASRSGALVVSGVVAVLICIAIGVFVDRWLWTPNVPANGASAPQEAIRSSLPAPAPGRPETVLPPEPVASPESVPLEPVPLEAMPLETLPLEALPLETLPLETLPLETMPSREPEQPRLPSTDPALAPVVEPAPVFEEDLVLVPRAEVQAVTGMQPDAGASERQAAVPPAAVPPTPPPDAGVAPAELAAADALPALQALAAEPSSAACGLISCAPGYSCCNVSCGICVAPGDDCDPTPCESKIKYPVSQLCGRATCSVGEVCCNPSCGTCVAPEESCDPTPCDNPIQYPVSQLCGRSTCSVGEVCCNWSCGTCVAPGETCSQDLCD
jgi:hypothetical protein